MYKFKIKTDVKPNLTSGSAVIAFLIDNKELKKDLAVLAKEFELQISSIQEKSFLAEEGSGIKIYKTENRPDLFIIHKIKIDENFSVDYFRNFFAGFIPQLTSDEIKTLSIALPDYQLFDKYFPNAEYLAQSIVEGVYYGGYSFDKYKSDKKKKKELEVVLFSDTAKELAKVIDQTGNLMHAVTFTRNLQNEPGMHLPPEELSARIEKTLSKEKIKVTIFDEKEIKKRKMGGVLAVGGGSANPPRFIVLEYKPSIRGKVKPKRIALVGKGVTFDAGGISLKPAAGMGEMKADMSGAAVVSGILLAAALSNLPVELIGVIPSVENMPSGKAYRPGDIVVTASGKTIEVDNTDAEGRIILADALDYASKLKPDLIIDLATLTGAVVVALGEYTAGLFTKDEALADKLYKSGLKTTDRVWRLPLWNEYDNLIKSDVADVKNTGGRWGGAITAAKFLEKFVDKNISWAHIDIAGPAMANNFNNYSKTFMTGFGVRLLFDFLINLEKQG
jgi:leucyl aminopeptidase